MRLTGSPVSENTCPLGISVNILVDCRLRVDQEALSDNRTGPSPLADPEHKLDKVLLRCGVLKRTCVDRLVACISVQLLDNLTCLLIAAPQVARGRARLANPIVERGEVDVERLRRRTVRPRLHEFGVRREAFWGVHTPEIRRVEDRLPLNALHVVEGLADSAARDRHDHRLYVRDVT